MEVTELDTAAKVSDAAFEIPSGYKETQMMPAEGQEGEQRGIGGLFRRKGQPPGGGGT